MNPTKLVEIAEHLVHDARDWWNSGFCWYCAAQGRKVTAELTHEMLPLCRLCFATLKGKVKQ